MKILQVIHGYPMWFNGGAEVYTQALCHALADRHEVHVFTRVEDPFAPHLDLRIEKDPFDPRVCLHLINNALGAQRHMNHGVDRRFAEVLEAVNPDVVHFGHLAHLSISLVETAAARHVPRVFTLHDYWLMCPRGQFLQMYSGDPFAPAPLCGGQEHRTCAERCYARRFSDGDREDEIRHWSEWVSRRMDQAREAAEQIDVFIAPATSLMDRFCSEWGLPRGKVVRLDYGMDTRRLRGRSRVEGEPFTFGYIGTHSLGKGVHHLIEAFGRVRGSARLRIWGRSRAETEGLRLLARRLSPHAPGSIEWRGEYRNQDIVRDVFDHVDAVVVPSIWVENSPLVIRESLQARVPVITADAGGMAELVHHEVNGLLFEHRSPAALAAQMQRCVDDPEFASHLGTRGDLRSDTGDVPEMHEHARAVEEIYEQILHGDRAAPRAAHSAARQPA